MDKVEQLQVLKNTVCWLHPVPSNLSEDPITFLMLPTIDTKSTIHDERT